MTANVAIARPPRWGPMFRILHWSVAVLVAGQILTGRTSQATADRSDAAELVRIHYQFGMTLAALVVLRGLWRLTRPTPPPIAGAPSWRRRAAAWTHAGLYGLLFVLPISGFVVWDYFDADMSVFGLVSAPDLFTPTEDERLRAAAWYVHAAAGWALVGLVGLHVAAAAWGEWVERDGVLRRML